MMRPSDALAQVYLCREPIDFRKGINTLAVLVEEVLRLNPFSEHLFVFTNRRADKVKILYWERSGFCLWQKRLEQERFKWPLHFDAAVVTLTAQELEWLLAGYDLRYLTPHKTLKYQTVL